MKKTPEDIAEIALPHAANCAELARWRGINSPNINVCGCRIDEQRRCLADEIREYGTQEYNDGYSRGAGDV